jgi:hypothetical protein
MMQVSSALEDQFKKGGFEKNETRKPRKKI